MPGTKRTYSEMPMTEKQSAAHIKKLKAAAAKKKAKPKAKAKAKAKPKAKAYKPY